jgi:polyhydroxyalkanoate synthesis repressor PhaR
MWGTPVFLFMAETGDVLQCGIRRRAAQRIFLHLQLCGAGRRFLRNISRYASGRHHVSDEQKSEAGNKKSGPKIVIKKYANRRLYNTATSSYVTLEDLSRMVKEGADFAVFDAKTGDDITRSVLTQIIFEEEGKENNALLPINFLRQLIGVYGNQMQGMVPGYLEFSMGNLLKDQDKLRQQMMGAFGGDAFKAMEVQAQRNMELFQESLKMFSPFAAAMPKGFANPFASGAASDAKPATEKPASGSPSKDDLQALKDQLSDMQQKLEALNKG